MQLVTSIITRPTPPPMEYPLPVFIASPFPNSISFVNPPGIPHNDSARDHPARTYIHQNQTGS